MWQLTLEEATTLAKFGINKLEDLTDPHVMYELLREFDRYGKVGTLALKGNEEAVKKFKIVVDLCSRIIARYNWINSEKSGSRYYLARGITEYGLRLSMVLSVGVDNSSNESVLELERLMFNPTNAIF